MMGIEMLSQVLEDNFTLVGYFSSTEKTHQRRTLEANGFLIVRAHRSTTIARRVGFQFKQTLGVD